MVLWLCISLGDGGENCFMGLKSWLRNKKQVIEDQTEQMRAEMLREKMKKPLKKGSMQDAYLQGMTPLEFGRLKKDKYLEKRKK